MRIQGNDVLHISDNGYLAVAFSQFDLGMKYKLYRKITYLCDDGGKNTVWEYVNCFGTQGEAETYMIRRGYGAVRRRKR
jgi:hypothetical protein